MSKTLGTWGDCRELLELTLVLFIYLVIGSSVYLLSQLPRAIITIVPGAMLLVFCGGLALARPLQCFGLHNGCGTNRLVMGMAALVALLALVWPVRQFGETADLGLILGLVVVVPLAEELFFRGFLFDHLQRNLGPWAAWLLSAVLFGGLHLDHGYVVSMIVLGLLAGGALLATRSVVAAVAVHVCWNACAVMEGADSASRYRVLLVALPALLLLYLYGRFTRRVSDESPSTEAVSPSA